MKKEEVEALVSAIVETIVEPTEMELVDVDYVRERDWYLRVYLDKPGGVDLDDCQLVSEQLSKALDVKDPIKENYLLEVSSPGLDRVLKKEKDFIRYKGHVVDVQLFTPLDGNKQLTGSLEDFSETTVTINIENTSRVLERKSVAQIRLHLEF